MVIRRLVGLPFAVALLLTSTFAQAQSCPALRSQLSSTNGELGGIAVDYPKTHLAIIACIAGNDNDSDRNGCVSTVFLGACFGLGPDGCTDLTTRWSRVGFKYFTILSQMDAIGCKP